MQIIRKKINRMLIANRGEIAIRVMRTASEMGIHTIAIFSQEDRLSLHRYKADESYLVGVGKRPIAAYLDIQDIIRIATETIVDAIHPGYGFLSENPEFAEACVAAGIMFIGPTAAVIRRLGNKVQARETAVVAGVPIMPASGTLPHNDAEVIRTAAQIGYPLMLKAVWGGGGRGMRVIEHEDDLLAKLHAARREALMAFGNDEVYLEKLVRAARHVEVQILGDFEGNFIHFYERDCTIQRRHQKVVERAPAPYINSAQRDVLCDAAINIARSVSYQSAGTVEFLQDTNSGDFYFIEVNPRIQVEHTVTECVTGIDLIKAQILVAEGNIIGRSELPSQTDIVLNGHALQCRITTEDPENNFTPDYGQITAFRMAAGFGVRLDSGIDDAGTRITPFYDSLLVKLTVLAQDEISASNRMERALKEFRVRGVKTNLGFLRNVITHKSFQLGEYTTTFIDDTPELFQITMQNDRGTRLLRYIGDVLINGNPETNGLERPRNFFKPTIPKFAADSDPIPGTKQILDDIGPEKFAQWMLAQQRVLITDTSMRDAHQSLLATRVRSHDLFAIAPAYTQLLPQLFSVECWGGATFDVCMRFLKECPWVRLQQLRQLMPNLLTQMLLRASNAVGYTNYPDNVVKFFVEQAATNGIDLFRVFDSLNWVENMRGAIEAVRETGKLCEASICYTGDISDLKQTKYSLKYYVKMAKELDSMGTHILGIKDMAGLLKPDAAKLLVKTLKEEVGLPIHFHTHDTSGLGGASILSAIDAGVDAVDVAMDSMSSATSQPSIGSIVAALQNSQRHTQLDIEAIRAISTYWEQVRYNYSAFETRQYCGASEVYLHAMPGGQFTNLRQQARALGIESHWSDISYAYARVNALFGDIPKVTPSSKVVGDMALMMVTSQLTVEDVMDPEKEISFPDSVVQYFRGELGQPPGGFPVELQRKVLKGQQPILVRPGSILADVDLNATRNEVQNKVQHDINDAELAAFLMYPKIYLDFAEYLEEFGDVSCLPSPVFFHGMDQGQEITVDLEKGKALVIRFMATSEPDRDGQITVFFELNGQPRSVSIQDNSRIIGKQTLPKAKDGDPSQVGAPMSGTVGAIAITNGQKVTKGDVFLTLEAMKMETSVCANQNGIVLEILVTVGSQVNTKDLLLTMVQ